MAIDKLNLFAAQSQYPPINSTAAVGGQPVDGSFVSSGGGSSSGNPFQGTKTSGSTVGINENIKNGDIVHAPAQAGKPPALLRSLAIA